MAEETAEVSPVAALQAAISNTLHQAPGQEADGEDPAEAAFEEARAEAVDPAAEGRVRYAEVPLYPSRPYAPHLAAGYPPERYWAAPPAYPYAHPQEAAPSGDASGAFDEPDEAIASIEEIRASLREFREAVRELTESRSRRRYF